MANPNQSVFKAEQLSLRIADQLLFEGLELDICKGSILGITGRSGVGKSTFCKTVLLSSSFWSGRLSYTRDYQVQRSSVGQTVTIRHAVGAWQPLDDDRRCEIRRSIGYLPQSAVLFPFMTAEDNVALPLRAQGLSLAHARKQARGCVERLGMSHLLDRKSWELSGGQRQRIAFARALVTQPDLLVLDEPTSSVDAATAQSIAALLRSYISDKSGRRAAIVVSHDVLWLTFIADHVLTLGSRGSFLWTDQVQNDTQRAFLAVSRYLLQEI